MITVFPDFHEVVLVDVTLIIVGPDACTGSDSTIGHYRSHRHTSLTGEETTTHLTFIIAKKTLTPIVSTDATFFTYLFNIIEHPTKLLICESHIRIESCATYWEDGKESPALDTLRNQELLDVIQLCVVAAIDTGDDVEDKTLCGDKHVYRLTHHLETLLVASHPVVIFF